MKEAVEFGVDVVAASHVTVWHYYYHYYHYYIR